MRDNQHGTDHQHHKRARSSAAPNAAHQDSTDHVLFFECVCTVGDIRYHTPLNRFSPLQYSTKKRINYTYRIHTQDKHTPWTDFRSSIYQHSKSVPAPKTAMALKPSVWSRDSSPKNVSLRLWGVVCYPILCRMRYN
ncbi:unnamed protein product [Ectocarpus fasciculatus]